MSSDNRPETELKSFNDKPVQMSDLSDEDLDSVAGGGRIDDECGIDCPSLQSCPNLVCGTNNPA